MLITTPLDAADAHLGAAYTVEQHLRRHGASLCDLRDALDDPGGFAALCDLYAAFGQPIWNADTVERALRAIQRILAEQTASSLERIGQTQNLPASDMARWHGARISELRAGFHHAR